MKKFEKVSQHAKNTGFVYPSSEIYGGLSNTWDFGPLGIELKNNIKNLWWKKFIYQIPNNVGLQTAILTNKKIWEASGHLANFSDPLMDCKECKSRFRADQLLEEFAPQVNVASLDIKAMRDKIDELKIACPKCAKHNFTEIRQFNLMFKTHQGVVEESKNEVYLRPETAQGIFVNFKNILRTTRKKLPFGVGQIGKSFRNEITPGNFIFRTREFEQMELEFFTMPEDALNWYQFYQKYCFDFIKNLGVNEQNLRLRNHSDEELSHYSQATCDIEYNFSFGWGEIWGIAHRSDFDLKSHQDVSKENLTYLDPNTNQKLIPFVIEPSVGVERLFLTFLNDAYHEEILEDESTRIVMKLHPALAPFKAAILPLTKKLSEPARELFISLSNYFSVDYDETGSIGKRYRRQDEIGTYYCITFDFDSLEDHSVTIRNRDSMEQQRVKIEDLKNIIEQSLEVK